MPAQTVMVIRHAEKPTDAEQGVSEDGAPDAHDLTVRGWRRAGALVRFFAPLPDGTPPPAPLRRPSAIFATQPDACAESRRPLNTVQPLADLLLEGKVDTRFGEGDEHKLASEVRDAGGDVLIAWHHQRIPHICEHLKAEGCPPEWPKGRFDLVWVFERGADEDRWRFSQVPQQLLAGDTAADAS